MKNTTNLCQERSADIYGCIWHISYDVIILIDSSQGWTLNISIEKRFSGISEIIPKKFQFTDLKAVCHSDNGMVSNSMVLMLFSIYLSPLAH